VQIKKKVAYLAMKLVNAVSTWIHTWMQCDQFYDKTNDCCIHKASKPMKMFGFVFADFGDLVESTLFNAYACIVPAPHRIIPNVLSLCSVDQVCLHVFSEGGKQSTYELVPYSEIFTASNIGLVESTESYSHIMLGTRELVARKALPNTVAKKKMVIEDETFAVAEIQHSNSRVCKRKKVPH